MSPNSARLTSDGLLTKEEFLGKMQEALKQADRSEYIHYLDIVSNGATDQTAASKPEKDFGVKLCMLGETIQSLNEMEETI